MKIPKKVTVFGRTYEIKSSPNLTLFGDTVWGVHDPDNKKIYLEENLTPEIQLATIVHELGHALMNRVGINGAGVSQQVEEIIVESYAQFITETFDLKFKRGANGTPEVKRLGRVPRRKLKAKG